jgi:hypothetical protein
MLFENSTESTPATVNRFTAADVAAILRERGWLGGPTSGAEAPSKGNASPARLERCPDEQDFEAWLENAAALLGPHAADRGTLANLLSLVCQYDACAILRLPDSHAVLAREGAREVIRELAHLVLAGPEIDSDRFKEIVNSLKGKARSRGRELFYPIRLALAGRAGEGELDRVILLLDRAARLAFLPPVKGTRQRMLEFCTALQ